MRISKLLPAVCIWISGLLDAFMPGSGAGIVLLGFLDRFQKKR